MLENQLLLINFKNGIIVASNMVIMPIGFVLKVVDCLNKDILNI